IMSTLYPDHINIIGRGASCSFVGCLKVDKRFFEWDAYGIASSTILIELKDLIFCYLLAGGFYTLYIANDEKSTLWSSVKTSCLGVNLIVVVLMAWQKSIFHHLSVVHNCIAN